MALLCAQPESVGIEAAAQIYAPHVDHGQRLLLLSSMATAALAMHRTNTPAAALPTPLQTARSQDEVGAVKWRAERALEAQRARQVAALGAEALDSALVNRRNNAVLRWTYALLSKAAEVSGVCRPLIDVPWVL